jgi:uncharacterized RDD family membrane protein YckC
MNRIGATVAMTWLAAAAAFAAPTTARAAASAKASAPAQAVDVPAPQAERTDRDSPVRWGYPVVRIGQDYTLRAGDTAREVTVIFGDTTIEGRVDRDVVVVLGSAHLKSTAVVDGSLVVVGGSVQAVEGARVREDLFVGGGGLDAPAGFAPGGHYVGIGSSGLDAAFRNLVPWLTYGLLWARPIVPSLPWVWTIALVFFVMNLLLNVVFDSPIKSATATLRTTPLSAFMSGLLVMVLAGPIALLLAVSVVGLAVVPFFMCALLIAAVLGKIAFARWIGESVVHQDEPDNRAHSLRSFLVGSAIMCIAYMIPVLGFVTWAMAGVFGLGASTQAFFSAYRRENPKPPKKVKSPAPEVSAPVAPAGPSPSVAYVDAPPAAEEPLYAAVTAPGPVAFASELVMLPRAAFVDRLAAFTLDVVLIVIATQVLNFDREFARVGFLLALAYHVSFWTLKGTTLGGIICQLRLVRVDGGRVAFPDALVRGLTGIFSLAVLGLGFLWILKDPDRQAWHDRVAGTYVVKVPRSWPI